MAPPQPVAVIAVDRATECHVTPMDVAARMVSYLGPAGDYPTLEPQAGTGNLIRALYDAGYSRHALTAIERHTRLCAAIRQRFHDEHTIDPMNQCFLAYLEQAAGNVEFSQIVMNPPFKKVKAHVTAALALLGRGRHDVATLVALVPATFRDDDAEVLEVLPPDTFCNTQVSTKIIRFIL